MKQDISLIFQISLLSFVASHRRREQGQSPLNVRKVLVNSGNNRFHKDPFYQVIIKDSEFS